MAAIVCLAISAMAEVNDDQALSPALWKQGVATCAHYTAHGRGFGKRIEEIHSQYPQGYTLDNLNDVYGSKGRRWESIYKEFKAKEGDGGSINDLQALVTPQVWKLAEPEIRNFIENPPVFAATEETAPADGQTGDEKVEGEPQDGTAQATADQPATAGKSGVACPADLPLWLGIIGTLLGLLALLTALSNRGKIKEMRRTFARELDRTNANLQEFSTDAADQMKALSIRLTGKALREKDEAGIIEAVADPEEAVAEPDEEADEEPVVDAIPVAEDDEEPAETPQEEPEQDEAVINDEEGEVMNLFMSRPDDNDDFTRVSDTYEPGNSVYVLTTFDGTHGTFEIIDKPEVHRFALLQPAENLMRACSGNAIQIPSGTRIVIDRAGEAEFIDGKWHVVVKAIIHYEG